MSRFFKVVLHFLYLTFVAGVEVAGWLLLAPLLGTTVTVILLVLTFVVLMMIYGSIFWGWRVGGFFHFLGDIGDGIGDLFT